MDERQRAERFIDELMLVSADWRERLVGIQGRLDLVYAIEALIEEIVLESSARAEMIQAQLEEVRDELMMTKAELDTARETLRCLRESWAR
jgi:hypothetical protein